MIGQKEYRPRIGNALRGTMEKTRNEVMAAYLKCENRESKEYMVIAVATYAILIWNEIITNRVIDAIGEINRDKSIYRQEVKKAVKEAEKIAQEYSFMVGTVVQMEDEMLDSLDQISERFRSRINNQLTTFYYSLKQVMDSNGVDRTSMRAEIEFCGVLLEISLGAQDAMERDNFLLRARIEYLRYLRLSKLKAAWEKVRYLVNVKDFNGKIDLNTERCHLACDNLQKAMCDYHLVAELLNTDG